ncbi:MAG TPA: protease complex subunit PrcB family protein [Thermoanaerobaculia bacterium]|jgi:hypothetical protein
MKAFASLALLAALLFTTSCTANGAVAEGTQTGPMDFRTLSSSTYAQADQPANIVVTDEATYRRTWETMIGSSEPPQADFATDTVIFLFGGMRPTGGYAFDVRGVRLEGDTLIVDGGVKSPPRGSAVTQALTSPHTVIAVKSRAIKNVRLLNETPAAS